MKKNIYYFSEDKMRYVEIRSFYPKFVSLVSILSILLAVIFFGAYTLASNLFEPEQSYSELRSERDKLEEKYLEVSEQLTYLNNQIDQLTSKENDLRLSVNLQPISDVERNFGIGGAAFDELLPTSTDEIGDVIDNVDNSIDLIKSKVLLAQENYSEIENKLSDNKKLFKSIPALLPTEGILGDRFGMRLHPILKIRRMHTGLDIVVNTGAKVYAPGDAKVVHVGNRGGYGLTIELDHGFGYTSLYAHLSKTKIKKGQIVKRGDLIGLSGQSGRLATGPHLHYEIKHNGVHLNPSNFIFSDIKLFEKHKNMTAGSNF